MSLRGGEFLRALALTFLAIAIAGCGSTAAAKKPVLKPKPKTQHRYSSPPKMSIDVHRTYRATVRTSDGTFTVKLTPSDAPLAVNNFIFLARHHFYDGNLFHRIIRGEYIQTGDPTGTGFGGPGYSFKVERPKHKYTVGTVAMARTNAPNSNGSQWFVIVGPAGTHLAPNYTTMGTIASGWKAIHKIESTPVGVNPGTGETSDPLQDVKIRSVTIK
jgi:cyclophilin family peptidyl-prolyl cis-trans isomerase